MHETTKAQSILRAVLERAEKDNLPLVRKVEVLVNPARGVDKEELLEVITELKRNTFLKDTAFELRDAELKAICKICGTGFPVNAPSDTCPACGSTDMELALLEEWEIAKME